jgi:hypothetical protein
MKTTKDWIEGHTDKKVRTLAMRNIYLLKNKNIFLRIKSDFVDSIECAFIWANSLEGEKFWKNIVRKSCENN